MTNKVIRNTRHIYHLIQSCVQKGARYAVVSPGSRCAPLLIGCCRHPQLTSISVSDERSAAFIAMGIAQQLDQPVILVCTSGTAGQNYAPAVTEAFYQHVPLFVLTADRPPEWIDQWDGQTIHQQNLYADHVKASMDFVAGNKSLQSVNMLLDSAINNAIDGETSAAAGPVHINIPISKPFYPESESPMLAFSIIDLPPNKTARPKTAETNRIHQQLASLEKSLAAASKILIICGQHRKNIKLEQAFAQLNPIPVVGDIISNLEHTERTDSFFNTGSNHLQADLLITLGRSVISEKHKAYFRQYKPTEHWHIGMGMVGDPYQTLTQRIAMEALEFFETCDFTRNQKNKAQQNYKQTFINRSQLIATHTRSCLSAKAFNQYTATAELISHLPDKSALHLANSMSVRVANHIGLQRADIEVWSNRGTSGIDGCVSTAVGHAIASPAQTHTLIIGDLAFLYDRNGLWLNQEFPDNLKIVVMNNNGGGIFKLIPGPSDQADCEKLFNTPHQRTAKLTAKEFDLNYQEAHTHQELQTGLTTFYEPGSAILEVFNGMLENEHAFTAFTRTV